MKNWKEISLPELEGKEVFIGLCPSGTLAYIHETENQYLYADIEDYRQKFTIDKVRELTT